MKEYHETVDYIHLNPVKAGPSRVGEVSEEWPRSSVHDDTGSVNRAPVTPSGLSVDRVLLPADERTRI